MFCMNCLEHSWKCTIGSVTGSGHRVIDLTPSGSCWVTVTVIVWSVVICGSVLHACLGQNILHTVSIFKNLKLKKTGFTAIAVVTVIYLRQTDINFFEQFKDVNCCQ